MSEINELIADAKLTLMQLKELRFSGRVLVEDGRLLDKTALLIHDLAVMVHDLDKVTGAPSTPLLDMFEGEI